MSEIMEKMSPISSEYHLGHLIQDCMKRYRNCVCQIDAATGEEETYESVLSRSIKLARALRAYGFKPGDVLAIGGKNHVDVHIPFYAALFNGLPIVGVDPYFKYGEIHTLFKLTQPKVAFCQSESFETYSKAAEDLGLQTKIITFDKGECTFSHFIATYDTNEAEEEFKPTEFDVDKIFVFLISTSGTTGKVKLAAFNHKPFMTKLFGVFKHESKYKEQTPKLSLCLSPVQWISSYFSSVCVPMSGDTMVMSSITDNFDHVIDIINKYRPYSTSLLSPTLMSFLISRKDEVDLKCFRNVTCGGSKVYPDTLLQFKELLPKDAVVIEAYGQTEMIGPVLAPNPSGPIGNCGRPTPGYNIKLMDPDTGVQINEPNVTGELWAKGLLRFTEYYNDPEETKQAFSEDGFFKTGDLLYRDQDHNYYFVDRIKTLIKYRNSHVLPSELEDVIRSHPSVKDVCVVGIYDQVDGQRPVACVVKNDNCDISAQEIKDLVAGKLSKNKELRGGVVFLNSLPLTSSGKLATVKLQKMIVNCTRE